MCNVQLEAVARLFIARCLLLIAHWEWELFIGSWE